MGPTAIPHPGPVQTFYSEFRQPREAPVPQLLTATDKLKASVMHPLLRIAEEPDQDVALVGKQLMEDVPQWLA